jgi:hypothetical protein
MLQTSSVGLGVHEFLILRFNCFYIDIHRLHISIHFTSMIQYVVAPGEAQGSRVDAQRGRCMRHFARPFMRPLTFESALHTVSKPRPS